MINCELAIKSGLCKADCCGPVFFTKEWVEKHRAEFQRPVEEIKEADGVVIVATKDGRCVFLDPGYRCKVYEDRPEVCRLYGYTPDLKCAYCKPNGNLYSEAKRKQIQRKIDHRIEESLRTMQRRYNGKYGILSQM
jgi:Fe-S-cluster containining protein